MKKLLSTIALSAMLLSLGVYASSKEVMIATTNVHVPQGFDANDYVTVIITGELPDTGWLRPYGEAQIVDGRIVITTKATRITDREMISIPAVIPYMISVPVGHLNEGKYQITVNPNTSDAKTSTIMVEQPGSQSIDNHTYANVSAVKYIAETKQIAVEGVHPSSCMEIQFVQILANATKDTFSLLPIIKQVQSHCDRVTKPFTYFVDLPIHEQKDTVIHVRKLDGNALNYLIPKNQMHKKNN